MNTTTNANREYDFSLILTGINDVTDANTDALFEAGCDDGTFGIINGTPMIAFSRSAITMKDAILSAIHNVRAANIGADVARVDECDLVSSNEIARRIQKPHRLVHEFMSGKSGPGGYPFPEYHPRDTRILWSWCKVSYWLYKHELINFEMYDRAEKIFAINNTLEARQQQARTPELVAEVAQSLAAS